MEAMRLAGAAAIALSFGATMALAQPGPHLGDGSNTKPIQTTTPGYSVGAGSARVGGGSDSGANLSILPQYDISSGSARVGGGSNAHPIPSSWRWAASPDGTAALGMFTGQGDDGTGWIGNRDGEGGPSNFSAPEARRR